MIPTGMEKRFKKEKCDNCVKADIGVYSVHHACIFPLNLNVREWK